MILKICIGVLGILIACTYCFDEQSHEAPNEISLTNFILSRWATANQQKVDPTSSSKCFAKYLPLLQDSANKWSAMYNVCVSTANEENNAIVLHMQKQRDIISNAANVIGSAVTNCQLLNDLLDFFKCFLNLSQNITNTVNVISYNASYDAAELLQKLNNIDIDMHKCSSALKLQYNKETASIYSAIDYCLANDAEPNPAPESTTATMESTITTIHE